jgi:hypothetical protein
MKIKEIFPSFDINDDLNGVAAVKIYRAILMGGKQKPNLSDYLGCPECGTSDLRLILRIRQSSWTKGICLLCSRCGWEKISDEWEHIPSVEQESLLAKYGPPKTEYI